MQTIFFIFGFLLFFTLYTIFIIALMENYIMKDLREIAYKTQYDLETHIQLTELNKHANRAYTNE